MSYSMRVTSLALNYRVPINWRQHWLDVPQRVQYKLCTTVHRCVQNKAPQYLVDCCTLVSDIVSQQHLRSASRHQLSVPRHRPFDIRLSVLLCCWSDGLELVVRQSTRPGTFFWQLLAGSQNLSILILLTYTAHLRLIALYKSMIDTDIDKQWVRFITPAAETHTE